MTALVEQSWAQVLKDEFKKSYALDLFKFIESEYRSGKEIYPPKELVFNALQQTPYEQVKVVIVGQDPYHGPGQAHGLSFSVPPGVPVPPSLRNIFREVSEDVGPFQPQSGCLTGWAKQGVLLLNAILTVQKGNPASHQGRGWERLTDAIIEKAAEKNERVVFLLWGKYAQQKGEKIRVIANAHRHIILTAPHPSPFSAHQGFFGCRHFSKTNAALVEAGLKPIEWTSLV